MEMAFILNLVEFCCYFTSQYTILFADTYNPTQSLVKNNPNVMKRHFVSI